MLIFCSGAGVQLCCVSTYLQFATALPKTHNNSAHTHTHTNTEATTTKTLCLQAFGCAMCTRACVCAFVVNGGAGGGVLSIHTREATIYVCCEWVCVCVLAQCAKRRTKHD